MGGYHKRLHLVYYSSELPPKINKPGQMHSINRNGKYDRFLKVKK